MQYSELESVLSLTLTLILSGSVLVFPFTMYKGIFIWQDQSNT